MDLWNNLSEEGKEWIKKKYAATESQEEKDVIQRTFGISFSMSLHGSEVVDSDPKNWEDIEKLGYRVEEDYTDETVFVDGIHLVGFDHDLTAQTGTFQDNPIVQRVIAELKIYKIIELGYGGHITESEWNNPAQTKYIIKYNPPQGKYWNGDLYEIVKETTSKEFLAFRSRELAEQFFSANRYLVDDYFMIRRHGICVSQKELYSGPA